MFRFLSCCECKKTQLQLAGAVCLLLSFKTWSLDVSVAELVDYTDNCYTAAELTGWEMLVAVRLDWRLALTSPLPQLRRRLRQSPQLSYLYPKAAELCVMSTQDSWLSLTEPHILADAILHLTLDKFHTDFSRIFKKEEEEGVEYILPGSSNSIRLEKVRERLRQMLLDDRDSGCGSSRGSDYVAAATDKYPFYTDFSNLGSKISSQNGITQNYTSKIY